MITIANGSKGEWIFINQEFLKAYSSGQIKNNFSNSVYEVMRVVDKVPVFIEDHYERFENSLKNFELKNYPSIEELKSIIGTICEKNSIRFGNLRFEMYFDESTSTFALYQIPHFYPTEELYVNGVHLVSFKIERQNPHIKQSVVNSEVRSRIASMQKEENAYEVVLINHMNEITEGSKSNIFFTSGTTLYTAPSNVILEGITRKQLIKLVNNAGIPVTENSIFLNKINEFDGCFLTGTSPKILPVKSIDSVAFNPNHSLVQKLMNLFNNHINDYCRNYS